MGWINEVGRLVREVRVGLMEGWQSWRALMEGLVYGQSIKCGMGQGRVTVISCKQMLVNRLNSAFWLHRVTNEC